MWVFSSHATKLEGQSAARFGWSICAWDQLVMLRFSWRGQGMDKVGDGDE